MQCSLLMKGDLRFPGFQGISSNLCVLGHDKLIDRNSSMCGSMNEYLSAKLIDAYLELRHRFFKYNKLNNIIIIFVTSHFVAVPEEGLQLVHGYTVSSGRVEISVAGKWGTICDNNFGDEDATVICRMLGFKSASKCFYPDNFGQIIRFLKNFW